MELHITFKNKYDNKFNEIIKDLGVLGRKLSLVKDLERGVVTYYIRTANDKEFGHFIEALARFKKILQ